MSWLGDWLGDDSALGRLGNWAVGSSTPTSLAGATSNASTTTAVPSKVEGGFFNDLKGVVKDPAFLSGALNTAVGLGSQLFADRRNQQNLEEDRKLAAEELALKAKYGLLGGQGGGGGSGTANLLNAYKAAIDSTRNTANAKGAALERLINASTRPLLR